MKACFKNNPQLLAFLQSHDEFDCADLFVILLGNGMAITATDWQLDVLNAGAPPQNFYATKYGCWKRGPIVSEASFGLASNPMSLTVTIPTDGPAVTFPGTNTPLFQTVNTGLFDKAQVWVYAAYAPLSLNIPNRHVNGFDTSLGLETKFMGEISHVEDLDQSQCTFSVSDLFYRMNENTPRRLIQSPCRWTLFDGHCALAASVFQVAAQVASGSTQLLINTTGALPSVGTDALPYPLGVVTFTSGQNRGLSGKVKSQASTTQFQLDVPMFLPVNIGDQFLIQPGCDLLQATCLNKFNNLIHFGGFPYIPQPEVVL